MLFDPKWNKPSLDSLIAWLETKNPTESYNFQDCNGKCLIGQYMASIGVDWGYYPLGSASPYAQMLEKLSRASGHRFQNAVAWNLPRTFGAALARAKAFKANQERN